MGDNLNANDLGTGRTAIHVSIAERHTCVVMDNYRVKCWGYNFSGQLGQEHTTTLDTDSEVGDNLDPIEL